jgi:class 3 adenylate cyclase/CheY-like chemotaxis protein
MSGPRSAPKPKTSPAILICEDSPIQATLLRRTLTQQGYHVTHAKDGAEGLKMVHEERPDLIISDVEMPNMDGYSLCRTIKQDRNLRTIPLMLLTTLAEPKDLMRGLNAGADNYLTKPYDVPVLLDRVKTLIDLSDQLKAKRLPPTEVLFAGERYTVDATLQRIFNLLLSTYENAVHQNQALKTAQVELKKLNQDLTISRKHAEDLLLNILPKAVADELIANGFSNPVKCPDITVLFTDFVGFTKVAESMSPQDLIEDLDVYFNEFDGMVEKYSLEKLKTIGDSYMAAGGIPEPNNTHAVDCVLAALEIQRFMRDSQAQRRAEGRPTWELRIGINSGPAVAGVIGKKKFAYDIWGDTVNMASRVEASGEPGKVNISTATYARVKDFFRCEPRGKIQAKSKGEVDMYFVLGLRPELTDPHDPLKPNADFDKRYEALKARG